MTLAVDDCPTAVVGHDLPWELRDITRVAIGNMNRNPASLWGERSGVQHMRCMDAD